MWSLYRFDVETVQENVEPMQARGRAGLTDANTIKLFRGVPVPASVTKDSY